MGRAISTRFAGGLGGAAIPRGSGPGRFWQGRPVGACGAGLSCETGIRLRRPIRSLRHSQTAPGDPVPAQNATPPILAKNRAAPILLMISERVVQNNSGSLLITVAGWAAETPGEIRHELVSVDDHGPRPNPASKPDTGESFLQPVRPNRLPACSARRKVR